MDTGLDLFLRGLLIGLAVAMPVGPISLLCLHRTLADGWRAGFAAGMGAATADAVYATTTGLGPGFAPGVILVYSNPLQLAGSLFLCLIGLHILSQEPSGPWCGKEGKMALNIYMSTFFLTLTNPSTILFFVAAFSSQKIPYIGERELDILLLVAGTFLGSSIWWLVLNLSASLFEDRISQRLWLLNIASGTLIILIGLFSMINCILNGALHTIS